MRRIILLLILLAMQAVPTAANAAVLGSPVSVSVTGDGMRLTLTVPRRVYPRGALIGVRVALTNLSTHVITYVPRVYGLCNRLALPVDVVDSHGDAVSPLPPIPVPPPCPAPLPRAVPPGQTISHWVRVAVLANGLRAGATVNMLAGTGNFSGADLATPVVRVRLLPASAPAVRVEAGTATVTKPAGAVGPLYYQGWATCAGQVVGVLSWTRAHGNTVSAGCADPQRWHFVAGWAGYPVAVMSVSPSTGSPILITPPFAPTPYTVHVGQTVEVKTLLLGPGADDVRYNHAYLRLLSASAVGAEPVRYDWRWQALAPGDTAITIVRMGPPGTVGTIHLHIVS
ncbi:MAG TPA: hypothetical protein VFB58_12220 [Chloroflexota bacterium]|nr:hypothetical protein [Chloroflexota bacterium]